MRVFDKDKLGADDPLGEVLIPLGDITADGCKHKRTESATDATEGDGRMRRAVSPPPRSSTSLERQPPLATEKVRPHENRLQWSMLQLLKTDDDKDNHITKWYELKPFGKMERASGRIKLRARAQKSEAS